MNNEYTVSYFEHIIDMLIFRLTDKICYYVNVVNKCLLSVYTMYYVLFCVV